MRITRLLRFFKNQALPLLVVCLVFIVLIAYIQLKNLQTNSSADAYTELYFTSIQTLSQKQKQNPLPIHFAIHNVEGKSIRYTYVVLLESQRGNILIDREKTVIANNQTKTVTEWIPPAKTIQSEDIAVYLLNKQEEIHLYL